MNKILLGATLISGLALVSGCSDQKNIPTGQATMPMQQGQRAQQPAGQPVKAVPRWYTQEQVERGYGLFQENCAECHKPDASGDPNWKQVNAEGKLPPPPLNGTAHAWHHPLPLLRRIVRTGGVPMGGTMPSFKDKLKPDEIDAILAWVQSHWSDEIYATWHQINQRKKH